MKRIFFSIPEKVNKIPRQQTVKSVTSNARLKFIENCAVIAPTKDKHYFLLKSFEKAIVDYFTQKYFEAGGTGFYHTRNINST